MSKKPILIIVALFVLVGGLAVFFFAKGSPSPKKITKTVPSVTPTPTPVTLATWTDEAGFSFQYPQGTTIDKHPEDSQNYANLTLTLPSKDTVNIMMSDNTFKDLDAWVGKTSSIDTTLEGRPAKKIVEGGLETITCIDNEVLVTISGKDTSGIVNSWKFIYPTPTTAKTSNTSTDENVLEEE